MPTTFTPHTSALARTRNDSGRRAWCKYYNRIITYVFRVCHYNIVVVGGGGGRAGGARGARKRLVGGEQPVFGRRRRLAFHSKPLKKK